MKQVKGLRFIILIFGFLILLLSKNNVYAYTDDDFIVSDITFDQKNQLLGTGDNISVSVKITSPYNIKNADVMFSGGKNIIFPLSYNEKSGKYEGNLTLTNSYSEDNYRMSMFSGFLDIDGNSTYIACYWNSGKYAFGGEYKFTFSNECKMNGHKWDDGTVTKAADCHTVGEKKYTCGVCHLEKYEKYKDNTKHTWENVYRIDIAPTTTSNGEKSIHCVYCNERSNITSIPKIKDKQIISSVSNKSIKYKKLKKKKYVINLNAKTSGDGELKYSIAKGKKKYITVSRKGVVTLKKGCKKGVYKIRIEASETSDFECATKIFTIKVK